MITSDKKLQAQAILRKYPHAFFERAMPAIMPGTEYLPNWHIGAMAAAVEEMIYGSVRRSVINIHPRMGKSLFMSVALPMFLLMRNPACQIMCISYSDQLASHFHQLSRLLAKHKWYRDLNPQLKFKSPGETSSVLKETGSILQTTLLGGRSSRSFNGGITGHGADWIIMDDANDMTQIGSEAHRNKINETFDQTIATRLNNKDGRIILVTQRGHIDDLSGHLLEKEGFKHLKIEAVASQRTNYQLGHGQIHTREKGDLIDPRRFGPPEIEERRRDLGSAAFEAQYQQNPQPPDGNLFKKQWFTIVDTVPDFQYVIISGDIAQSLGKNDYTAFVVWGYCNGIWYVIAAYRVQEDLPGIIRFYKKLDEKYEPDLGAIEKNGPGTPFISSMNDIGYQHVDGTHVLGDKIVRSEAVSPLIERKEVAILRSMPLYDKFMDELLSFPSSKYDDMVDAFTFALNHRHDILRAANFHRRPKRRHLPQARSNMVGLNITTYGDSSGTGDRYFARMGRSVFSR